MLDILIASHPATQTRPGALIFSSALHVTLVALSVIGTRATITAVSHSVADTTLIFLPRVDPPATPPPRADIADHSVVLSANPPPKGFQVVSAPVNVPTAIPDIDLHQRVLDPRDFTGRGVEGGTSWGVAGGTGKVDESEPGAIYAANLSDDHFVAAELLVPPHFASPPVMVAAGIEGRVVLKFIVDTLGIVEPASIKVLETTHEAFSNAARTGILEARFAPARYNGRPVRQLSQMPVRFVISVGGSEG